MEEKLEISKSPKNRTMLYLIIMAFIFGAIAMVLIKNYLYPKRTTVWLFNANYKAGTALTDDMLYAVQADDKIFVGGAESDINSQFITGSDKTAIVNSGDSLRIDVAAGYPLTKSMLSMNGGTAVEMNMDPSKVCISASCTDISAVSSEITKGSRVNVYHTHAADTGGTATSLVFQSMKVADTSVRDGNIQRITLEMTVEESIRFINYQNTGSLQFGLVDPTGYQYVEDEASFTSNIKNANVS